VQLRGAAYVPGEMGTPLAVFSLITLLAFEAACILLVVGALKGAQIGSFGFWRVFCVRFCMLLVYLFLTVYVTYIVSNWGLFRTSLSFSSPKELYELIVHLGITNIIRTSSIADLTQAFFMILLVLVIPAILVYMAPAFQRSKSFFICAAETAALLSIGLYLGIASKEYLEERSRLIDMRPVYKNILSPQFALIWSDLIFGKEQFEFTPIAQELEPSYSLEEYASKVSKKSQKNVILLLVEALRSDVPGREYNSQPIMPELTSLAASGHSFSRAYAQSPETSYSQSTLVLGQHPLRYNTRDTHRDLAFSHARIYDLLAHVGYRTAHLSYQFAALDKLTKSELLDLDPDIQHDFKDVYKQYLPEQYQSVSNVHKIPTAHLDAVNVKLLQEWISPELGEGEVDKPFFALMYLYSSHFPYNVVSPMNHSLFGSEDLAESLSFFDYPKSYSEIMKRRYYTTLRYIDTLLANLLKHLADTGKLENTVIIVTGDHGEAFHEHGVVTHSKYMWEELLRVPLIIFGANDLLPCSGIDTPVGHVDIAPTILEILGLPQYGGFQGSSILCSKPAEGEEFVPKQRAPVYASIQGLRSDNAIIDWPWKLISPQRSGTAKLFNLRIDPKETVDLFSEESTVASELQAKLEQFRDEQFSYYLADENYRLSHFPPRLD
jgi:arylsulfatase A-like enzyme